MRPFPCRLWRAVVCALSRTLQTRSEHSRRDLVHWARLDSDSDRSDVELYTELRRTASATGHVMNTTAHNDTEGNNDNWKLEKKLKQKKSRNAVRVISPKRCQMSMEGRIWEIGKFWVWNARMMGWWMIRVVMVTLVRWDDLREEMNQEEADQDAADEVSEEVDSRGKAIRSEKNDW